VAPLLQPVPRPTEAAHAAALQMLERYGVVTREAVLAENVVGGYAGVYGVLKVLEERGQTRRGYFVAGLGAAQFSVPGAVDRLRAVRETSDPELHPDEVPAAIVLAATDPAQPYGAALPWPASAGRPARSAGALVVLWQGRPLVWFDRRSHHLVTFPDTLDTSGGPAWAEALAARVKDGRARSMEVRKVDGDVLDGRSPVADVLRRAGFVDSYRGVVFRAS
jgi:ATP-dependent Lhr-like helicase